MNQDEIEAVIAFRRHESGMDAEDRRWDAYVREVERLLGVDSLDGDQDEDGYSLDYAHDFFVGGLTAEEAATEFRSRMCAHEWGGGNDEYPRTYCLYCGQDGDA